MRTKRVLCISLIIALSLLVITSCYQARYSLEKCNTESQGVEFTSKYEADTFTAYFDSSVKTETADEWIDRFLEYSALLSEKEIDNSLSYYVSDKIVVNHSSSQNGVAISLPANIAKDEAFAWVLAEKLGNKLPYGVYAGIAAYWLNGNKIEYTLLTKTDIANAGYLAEMQFPIYETDNLSEAERTTAWNISYTIIDEWIKSGKELSELTQMTKGEFDTYLQSAYNISLPNYEFSPYTTEYEYEIIQGCFTYYVNKEFVDLVLPKSEFSAKYNHLSDWLKDNWKTKLLSDEYFGIEEYTLYFRLNNGAESPGYLGVNRRSTLDVYAAGYFSGIYIYNYLYYKAWKWEDIQELISDLQTIGKSKYADLMFYYIYSGESPTYHYDPNYQISLNSDKKLAQKDAYLEAMKLYNKNSSATASKDNFDFWLYSDCFSALFTKSADLNEPWWPQQISFFRFVENNYGIDVALRWQPYENTLGYDIDFTQVAGEWIDYLQAFSK